MTNPQAFDVGYLETSVSKPQKENEGAKDTYVSYLVTTKVCIVIAIHDYVRLGKECNANM